MKFSCQNQCARSRLWSYQAVWNCWEWRNAAESYKESRKSKEAHAWCGLGACAMSHRLALGYKPASHRRQNHQYKDGCNRHVPHPVGEPKADRCKQVQTGQIERVRVQWLICLTMFVWLIIIQPFDTLLYFFDKHFDTVRPYSVIRCYHTDATMTSCLISKLNSDSSNCLCKAKTGQNAVAAVSIHKHP